MKSEPTIILHGNEWKLSDVVDDANHCASRNWQKVRWFPRDEIKSKAGGASTIYHGQSFDPEKQEIIKDEWNHDHCEICWWTLFDSENEEENTGYFDGQYSWVCLECYEKLVLPKKPKT